jgi:peptidoglycan hydrolase-like protein with peptidoglycan-binding domain
MATEQPHRGQGRLPARARRRTFRSGVALLVAALLVTLGPAGTGQASTASSSAAHRAAAVSLTAPFSREVVRPGAVDASPYAIAHVYELQRRLKRVGLFHVTPTGYYGPVTKRAVLRFKKRNHLGANGVVGAKMWRKLIRQSVRGRGAVPAACKGAGWHACYDRWRHQVNLYHRGTLLNSWLVRGGSSSTPTRTGSYVVYYRDIDHVSSRFDDAPMPYSQFFDGGQALHGSRLMMDPYVGHSHGCVNFWTEDARQLWRLTADKRLHVHVYGAWS